jgi:hypothetical protein
MRHERSENPASRPPGACADDALPEVVQGADGRWRWEPVDAAPGLSFRDRDDAVADRTLRHRAPLDASGRGVLPKDHLRKLVSAIAQGCPGCADVYFGGVFWHPRDAGGCNWSVGIMSGPGDHAACRAGVLAAKAALRHRYAIADEA